MNRISFIFFIILSLSPVTKLSGAYEKTGMMPGTSFFPDSLRDRQFLYNGTLWTNNYKRYNGNPYLFADYFLPGEIWFNGRHFSNVELRYDIFSDEVMIPRTREQIISLNREMVDSFSIVFEKTKFNFIYVQADSLSRVRGYVNEIYEGKSSLYVKYSKGIFTNVTDGSDGEFYQVSRMYIVLDGIPFEIEKLKDLLKLIGPQADKVRDFIRTEKIKVSRNIPESFVPVVRFYDSINK
jgi:hypothetical protein